MKGLITLTSQGCKQHGWKHHWKNRLLSSSGGGVATQLLNVIWGKPLISCCLLWTSKGGKDININICIDKWTDLHDKKGNFRLLLLAKGLNCVWVISIEQNNTSHDLGFLQWIRKSLVLSANRTLKASKETLLNRCSFKFHQLLLSNAPVCKAKAIKWWSKPH